MVLSVAGRLHALYDARIGEAQANRQMAELALAQVEQAIQSGQVTIERSHKVN